MRTLWKERKRLMALGIISALGVTIMCGVIASCDALKASADAFFDEQKLHDVTIVSTLGLNKNDLEEILEMEDVEKAEGIYSKSVSVDVGDSVGSATLKVYWEDGVDLPYVIQGRLPVEANEIAVVEKYMAESEKSIGDKVTVSEYPNESLLNLNDEDFDEELVDEMGGAQDELSFRNTEYTITGVIIDPTSVVNTQGVVSFRDAGGDDYICVVSPSAVDSETFTAINVTLKGAKELDTFSDEYEELIENFKAKIEDSVKAKRESERASEVYEEAEDAISEAESKINNALSDAKTQLDDAGEEISSGYRQSASGAKEIENQQSAMEQQLKEARSQIESGYAQINDAKAQMKEYEAQIAKAEQELAANEEVLLQNEAEYQNQVDELNAQKAELQAEEDAAVQKVIEAGGSKEAQDAVRALYIPAWAELSAKEVALEVGGSQLKSARRQFDEGKQQLLDEKAKLAEGWKELYSKENALREAEQAINNNEASGYAQLEAARRQINEGYSKLKEGESEYLEGVEEYNENKKKIQNVMNDARDRLDEITECTWYVQDRNSLNGWADIKTDSDCISAIGKVFPILFLLVAILISLTTITRMVEEDRSLIGTYKALGYSGSQIRFKYVLFSGSSSLMGGVLGNVLGFIVIPKLIFIIFQTMYTLPKVNLVYDLLLGLGSSALFFVAIVGAAIITCNSEIKEMPAVLMRQKSPKSGTRILLERWNGVWKKMSFLNKVAARNIFRYKKRMLMTTFGIAGCTALLICGFSIKDTVKDLCPKQYEDVIRYDMLVATAGEDDNTELLKYLDKKSNSIENQVNIFVTTAIVKSDDNKSITLQMYVFPDGIKLENYYHLKSSVDGREVALSDEGIAVTKNTGTILEFGEGSIITVQDMTLNSGECVTDALVEYYLGNAVFMSQSYYEDNFGEFNPNAVLLNLKTYESAFVKEIESLDFVMSVTDTQALIDNFSEAFVLMDMVVYVIIILAAALAFVVLFTLSITNISEREREIATIKVLGFHKQEVYHYINKETFALTGIGIIAGFPLGWFLSESLGMVINIPSFVYETSIHAVTFLIAAALVVIFAILVKLITDRYLDKVDPTEALKSLE